MTLYMCNSNCELCRFQMRLEKSFRLLQWHMNFPYFLFTLQFLVLGSPVVGNNIHLRTVDHVFPALKVILYFNKIQVLWQCFHSNWFFFFFNVFI